MDFLVKYNITKKEKIIVDAGHRYVKFLYVEYAGGEARIKDTYKTDAYAVFDMGGELNLSALAKLVNEVISIKKVFPKCNINLSLPSELLSYKISAAKNIKLSELDRHIRSNLGMHRVSADTHNIDKTYLGKKELNGDTLYYYMAGAMEKSLAAEIAYDFKKYGLTVTGISFPLADMALLPNVIRTDEPNKVYIDFGASSTKLVVEALGVAVYCREIDIGYYTFVNRISDATGLSKSDVLNLLAENKMPEDEDIFKKYSDAYNDTAADWQVEVARVVNTMEDDGILITGAVLLTELLPRMDDRMKMAEMKIVSIWDASMEQAEMENHRLIFLKQIKDMAGFGCCLGGVASAYLSSLNLLNQRDKDESVMNIAKKASKITAAVIASMFFLSVANAAIRTVLLEKAEKNFSKYNEINNQITQLTDEITAEEAFIEKYNERFFPVTEFLKTLEIYRPEDVAIISVDNAEILSASDSKEDAEGGDETEETEATEEAEAKKAEPIDLTRYSGDLKGKALSVRGMGKNPETVSKYVKNLMGLEFVEDAELTGIEEKTIAGEKISIFEIILTLKGAW